MKRTLDWLFAAFMLIVLSPLLVITIALVRLKIGSPVFFRQERPGLRGKSFMLIKFRTMLDATDEQGRILPDRERLTKFGIWLRSSSIDELPELLNVLRGSMSLVGPRPLLAQYLSLYSPEQARRHEVRPGLTGWAQVNGRNALSWDEKFALDIWYVDNQTLMLDLRILWMTIRKVLFREGISADGEATMPPFTGSNQ